VASREKVYIVYRTLDYVVDIVEVFKDPDLARDYMEFHAKNPIFLKEFGINVTQLSMKEFEVKTTWDHFLLVQAKKTIEELTERKIAVDSELSKATETLKRLVKQS